MQTVVLIAYFPEQTGIRDGGENVHVEFINCYPPSPGFPGLPNLSNTRYFFSILNDFNCRSRHFVVEINFFQLSMVGNKIHIARHIIGFLRKNRAVE